MATYSNTSPIDYEDITTETGIMVISFNPNDPKDKPNVSYYSSQEDFEGGWSVGNCCPLTRNPRYLSVALSTLTPDQLSSLHDLDDAGKLQEGVLNSFSEKSYAKELYTEYFNKSIKPSREIQGILDGFKEKIATIGDHHQAAKGRAEQLYNDLVLLKEETFKEPTNEKLAVFPQKIRELIGDATPVLQKDLDWGDYLSNFAKELCNAATKLFTAGRHQGFFAIKISDAVKSAEDLGTELEKTPKLD